MTPTCDASAFRGRTSTKADTRVADGAYTFMSSAVDATAVTVLDHRPGVFERRGDDFATGAACSVAAIDNTREPFAFRVTLLSTRHSACMRTRSTSQMRRRAMSRRAGDLSPRSLARPFCLVSSRGLAATQADRIATSGGVPPPDVLDPGDHRQAQLFAGGPALPVRDVLLQ
jgi:hypothetical protein